MTTPPNAGQPKPLRWVGSSKEDVSAFPPDVRWRIGGALWDAQIGRKASYARPLRGFGDAGVLEIVDDFDGDAFRAVYTVRFAKIVTCCTPSRRNRSAASPRPNRNWI